MHCARQALVKTPDLSSMISEDFEKRRSDSERAFEYRNPPATCAVEDKSSVGTPQAPEVVSMGIVVLDGKGVWLVVEGAGVVLAAEVLD